MNKTSVLGIFRQIQPAIKETAIVFFVLILSIFIVPKNSYATINTNPASTTAGDTFIVSCDSTNNAWRVYDSNGNKYFAYSGQDCGIEGQLDIAGVYTIVETSDHGASPDILSEIESSSSFVGETQITVNPGPTSTPTETPTETPTPTLTPSNTTTVVVTATPNPTSTLTPTPTSTSEPTNTLPTSEPTDTPTPKEEVLGQATAPAALAPVAKNQDPTQLSASSSPSFLVFATIILLFLLFNFAIYFLYAKYKKRNKVFQENTAEVKESIQNIEEKKENPVLEKKDYLIENPTIDEIRNAFEKGSIVSLGIVSNLSNALKNSPDHWVVVKNFVEGKLSINDPLFQSKKDVFLNERYANWKILKAKIYN
jgi:preprotein translocase subunit SecG